MVNAMEVRENEILLIYDSNDMHDKEARVYVHSFRDYKVKDLDINHESLTERQFAELAQKIGVDPVELMDANSQVFKDNLEGTQFSEDDILKMLKNNPQLVKTPIVVYHDRAEIIGSPHDFIKEDMAARDISLSQKLKQEESS